MQGDLACYFLASSESSLLASAALSRGGRTIHIYPPREEKRAIDRREVSPGKESAQEACRYPRRLCVNKVERSFSAGIGVVKMDWEDELEHKRT
jgi:hypothetical protein